MSVAATAALGWVYWENIWLGLIGLWPLLKSAFSTKSLWALGKKMPLLALAGFKKYALKLFAATMGMQLGARFHWVQSLTVRCRAMIARTTELLTTQWGTLNIFEKALVLFFSFQLVVLLVFVLLLSKSLQLLALKSGSESTAEQVVKRSIPQPLSDKLDRLLHQHEGRHNTEEGGEEAQNNGKRP